MSEGLPLLHPGYGEIQVYYLHKTLSAKECGRSSSNENLARSDLQKQWQICVYFFNTVSAEGGLHKYTR
eukprot:scaffold319695_cov17-Tisochrysis_lutea.AAC.1